MSIGSGGDPVVNFAVIGFDGINLLLPQRGVGLIEMSSSIQPSDEVTDSIGMMKTTQSSLPVFAMNGEFKTLNECPDRYKFCVAINTSADEGFSVACEEVSTMIVNEPENIKPLRACMRSAQSPVEFLFLKDNRLMLVSEIETLYRFLLPGDAA